MIIQNVIRSALNRVGFDLSRFPSMLPAHPQFPEFQKLYERVQPYSLVTADRCWILYSIATQAASLEGDFWECGVYRGGTAILLADVLSKKNSSGSKRLHLFDTFEGMPETNPAQDKHQRGDFADTSLETVQRNVGHPELAVYHPGFIPKTFAGLESAKISFAHVDVDIYQSVKDCCEFIYPRLAIGGFILFDDYGFPTCPGARAAVNEFFQKSAMVPLLLPTAQALVFKSQ